MTDCACLQYPGDHPLARLYLGFPALRYQQQGYAVLPLDRGGKRPHRMLGDRGGVHWATTDPAMPPWAWQQDPAANIGIATGWRSRLVVIDLDVKGGADGPAEWDRFVGLNRLQMPSPACWAETPSGGMHIWLRTPDGEHIPERHPLPAVDVKGDGGLIVAPPSMQLLSETARAGGRDSDPVPVPYRWLSGCPCSVPDAPPWLLPWLASAPSRPGAPGEDGDGSSSGLSLETAVRTGIPRGQRNSELYRLACARFRFHGTGPASHATVAGELRQVLAASDTAGFGPAELLTILRSARSFVAGSEEAEKQWNNQVREMITWPYGSR